MTGSVRLGESAEERRERLGEFLRRLAPVAAVFGLIEAWAGFHYRDRAALTSAFVVLLYAGCALVAARLNAVGRTEIASALASASITATAVALVLLQPELHPALAVVPLIGAVLAFPYVHGRQLAALLVLQVVASAAIATCGALMPPRTFLPENFDRAYRTAATTTVIALVAYFLWQHRRRSEARWIDEETRRERLEAAIAELTGREREARLMAMRDPVTGLANRRLFLDRLEETMLGIERADRQAAILFLDLDRFKEVNDRFGHAAGDRLLARVAEVLQTSVRATETLARFGGDEFVLIMPRIDHPTDPEEVARRLLKRLAEPIEGPWGNTGVSASVGLALAPDHSTTAAGILRSADAAMYRAKNAGGGQFAWGRKVNSSGARLSGAVRIRDEKATGTDS